MCEKFYVLCCIYNISILYSFRAILYYLMEQLSDNLIEKVG